MLQQCLGTDEQHHLAQELLREHIVAHPFQIGGHLITVEVLTLI